MPVRKKESFSRVYLTEIASQLDDFAGQTKRLVGKMPDDLEAVGLYNRGDLEKAMAMLSSFFALSQKAWLEHLSGDNEKAKYRTEESN